MTYILNIETSTTNCSVSLAKDGKSILILEDNSENYSHAERLHVFIQELFEKTGVSKSELAAVAVSKGPGSYTGLRIGVSTAKGICYALNIPLIAVSTLKVLAVQVENSQGLIVPMLDARRMEVYSTVLDSDLNEVREIQAEVLDENSFSNYLTQGPVYFIGNGVQKMKTVIKHTNAHFIEGKMPSAREMAALSYYEYKIGNTEDVAYFEPYYLKDFIALKPKS
ncbi:tRNA (adenosine(37)-N6)-threonylcarbamoyltransferase complex dimerization subunit type 1 TsaB [Mangrovimonas sp. ST2L15]|uniref:tRNA (adenosine(37)-N6)-threonylcarbamoyltransferase complex dimerization subunit type 1 TsaB n=1 Tax=Mangrovimonas sp. ST2L15 TaxID=1645916 RepID=UPI0006B60734|nr:tRNA (adenosine(37)-N6)-threonylcarbamoyltransferase complex dimerization subunit type 1 TsaB [Mangrovimonas sp. ST2L15]